MKSFSFIALLCCMLAYIPLWSQPAAKRLSWNDQFILDQSGHPFPVQDSFVTLNGKVYNFTSAQHPAFVYISSESCLPCKFELPLYLDACTRYSNFDFVYFTTDPDTLAIREKFGAQWNLPNLYIINRPYEYFYDRQLFLGFPTKYFIDSKRKVETVQLGGYMVKEKVLAEWQPVLTRLQ